MKKEMRILIKRWGLSVGAILVGGLSILLLLLRFNLYIEKTMEQLIRSNMDDINQAAIMCMRHDFDSFIDLLEQQGQILSMMDHPDDAQILSALVNFADEKGYKNAAIVTYSGKIYSSFRGITQAGKDDKLPNLMKNETTVSQPRTFIDDTLVIDISTPVNIDGENIGKLVVSIGSDFIAELFSDGLFEGDAALNLITQEGVVIARISGRPSPVVPLSNIFDFYKEAQFIDGTADELLLEMSLNNPTWIKYRYLDETVGVSYMPLDRNNWYMTIAATDTTLYEQSVSIQKNALLLTLCIMLVVVSVSVLVVIQRINQQKKIDALKNTYNIAIKKTNDLFYEADIENENFVDYSEQKDKAIWKEPPTNYSNALTQVADACAPEYRQQFLDTFLPQNIKVKIKEGISSIHFEYKISPDPQTVRWLSATFVPINDGDGTKMICMENDITESKLKQEYLRKSAIMDGLTGLYNKVTTRDCVNHFLWDEGKGGKHALALIDIDYFKQVNDTLGHVMGDTVLSEFGRSLKRIFRKSDILGRVGGDEFMVFLKDYSRVELIRAKMNEVLNDLRRDRFSEEDMDKCVRTSASIGIAIYSKDGTTFDELYKAADIALYQSKNAGRDRFTFF